MLCIILVHGTICECPEGCIWQPSDFDTTGNVLSSAWVITVTVFWNGA